MRRTEIAWSISATVTDISLSGCYVELMEIFPVGIRKPLHASHISTPTTAATASQLVRRLRY